MARKKCYRIDNDIYDRYNPIIKNKQKRKTIKRKSVQYIQKINTQGGFIENINNTYLFWEREEV